MPAALRTIRYVGAVLLGLVAVYGAYDTAHAFVVSQKIDPQDRCRLGETGQCFTRERGIVAEGGRFYEIKVRYADGRRTAGLFMLKATPALGTRVWLEWWDGDVVALYDSSTERRYRTRDWPLRFDWAGTALTLFFLGLAATCWPWRRKG